MTHNRELIHIDGIVHKVALYNQEMRIGGTMCTLHFFAESDDQPLPPHLRQVVLDGLTNQHIGQFARDVCDAATCMWCLQTPAVPWW